METVVIYFFGCVSTIVCLLAIFFLALGRSNRSRRKSGTHSAISTRPHSASHRRPSGTLIRQTRDDLVFTKDSLVTIRPKEE